MKEKWNVTNTMHFVEFIRSIPIYSTDLQDIPNCQLLSRPTCSERQTFYANIQRVKILGSSSTMSVSPLLYNAVSESKYSWPFLMMLPILYSTANVVAELENEVCKPRPVLVEVKQTTHQHSFRFPFYVTLHRCRGSCGSDPFRSTCTARGK